MYSEMVINALKYAFPGEARGTISVLLAVTSENVELIVEDDGVGVVEDYSPGQGGGLLDQLAEVAGTVVRRTIGSCGHGFRVSALMPALASQEVDA